MLIIFAVLFVLFLWGLFVMARDRNAVGVALMWVPVLLANGLAVDGLSEAPAGAGARIWGLFFLPPTLILLLVLIIGWTVGKRTEVSS